MKRRFTSIVLAAAMAMSAFTAFAADDDVTADGSKFNEADSGIESEQTETILEDDVTVQLFGNNDFTLSNTYWYKSSDGTITATAVVENCTSTDSDYITLYVIGYDENGTAVETRSQDCYIYSGESEDYSITLDYGNIITDVKFFLGNTGNDITLLSSGVVKNSDGTISTTAVVENCTNSNEDYITLYVVGYGAIGRFVPVGVAESKIVVPE